MQPMAKILILHGPTLNLLGSPESSHPGEPSLAAIDQHLNLLGAELGHEISTYQSNTESALIEKIQTAPQAKIDLIIINPAAFTYTSIALRDALLAIALPFIEVHLSNIYAREAFRRNSLFSDVATGVISGFGANSYQLALHAAYQYLQAYA